MSDTLSDRVAIVEITSDLLSRNLDDEDWTEAVVIIQSIAQLNIKPEVGLNLWKEWLDR